MAKKEKQMEVPTVLAFEKKLVPSDGYLYGTTWEKRTEEARPLELKRKISEGNHFESFKTGRKK